MTTHDPIEVTDEERGLLRHALGLTEHCRTEYRNGYLAGHSGYDMGMWSVMVQKGLAERGGESATGRYFRATDAGKAAARRGFECVPFSVLIGSGDYRSTQTVYERTRSAAKYDAISSLQEAWGLSFIDAARCVKSVRRMHHA